MFRTRERLKYKHNVEYHDKIIARAKALHRAKTADIPKLRRGRKPHPKPDNIDENPVPRLKGRPKMKAVVNVYTIDVINSYHQLIIFFIFSTLNI